MLGWDILWVPDAGTGCQVNGPPLSELAETKVDGADLLFIQ